jgi:hypothetical protein
MEGTNEMRAIIDGDILRYEVGFGAETAWRAIVGDGLDVMKDVAIADDPIPPFDFVREMLIQRIAHIQAVTEAASSTIYLTEDGPNTFRFKVATLKPYKGTRKSNKPWHFNNLTVYMRDVLGCVLIRGIEADDAMAIDHLGNDETVLCSRDKDLRQIPGRFFSWELGAQPSFGPVMIDDVGTIELKADRKDIKGTGFAFFAAQLLIGDKADNIPGLPKCGPVAAFDELEGCTTKEEYIEKVVELYSIHYGEDEWEERLLEQGRLCWLLRSLNEDGSIPLWTPGVNE